jgi:hypothetical protein
MFLGCEDGGTKPSSTVDTSARGHSILRVMMTDDAGKHLTFDVDIDLSQAATKKATSWVHVSLAVTQNSIRTYIDGQKVPADHIGYATDRYFRWATQPDNLALGNPEDLARGSLGTITLAGCAYIGGGVPGSWASRNVSQYAAAAACLMLPATAAAACRCCVIGCLRQQLASCMVCDCY